MNTQTRKSILLVHPIYHHDLGKVVVYHMSGKMETFTYDDARKCLEQSNKASMTTYYERVLEAFPESMKAS